MFIDKIFRLKSIIFILQLLISGSCSITFAQTPTGKIPGKTNGGFPKEAGIKVFPTSSKEVEQFKNYLKQIKTIKEQYAELGEELDSLMELDVQPEVEDSLWTGLKDKAHEHAEMQISLMDNIQGKIPTDHGNILQLAKNFKSFLEKNKEGISFYQLFEEMEFYLDNTEENLKAFTNEHLGKLWQDPLGNYLAGQGEETQPLDPDIYGAGLDQMNLSTEEIEKTTQDGVSKMEKSLIADQTGQAWESQNTVPSGAPVFSGIGDKTGETKSKFKRFRFFEKNLLKGKPTSERWVVGGAVNSLDAFGEGINACLYLGYRFSQQLAVLAGPNLKKEWESNKSLSKEGHGGHLFLQYMTEGKWLGQLGVEHNYVTSVFPDIRASMGFQGFKTYPLLGLGKEISLSKKIRSTFIGLWDPFYNSSSRLHNQPLILRVGLVYY